VTVCGQRWKAVGPANIALKRSLDKAAHRRKNLISKTFMSDSQLRAMIEREAGALGLTAEEAISRVKKGDVGANYLWQDLASLISLLE